MDLNSTNFQAELLWLFAIIAPIVESGLFLRIARRWHWVIGTLIASLLVMSAGTLTLWLWLSTTSGGPSSIQNVMIWNVGGFLVCFHVGGLIMLNFRRQIGQWYQSHEPKQTPLIESAFIFRLPMITKAIFCLQCCVRWSFDQWWCKLFGR